MKGAPTTRTMMASAMLGALLFSSAAHAHPGHAEGGLAGLLHPLLGLDHLLAMIAVGIWAALLGNRARWIIPASFLAIMTLAALAGIAGLTLPMVEMGIAGSVLLAGLLIGLRIHIGALGGAALVGVFALFHGLAHGIEIPASAVAWQYIAGFVSSTALLHAAGVLLGTALMRWKPALPMTGALLFAGGGWMLAAV